MKTIVATATTEQEANDIWLAIIAEQPHIEFANITGLQVTVVYTPVAEVEAQQEQADKEFWQKHAQPEITTKTRKQPTIEELRAKVEKLFLDNLLVARVGKKWQIVVGYGKNCDEVLYTCKTPIGISRQLTKMSWDKQIARLISDGVIAS